MNSAGMLFKLPLFEIKNFNENGWKKVSEKDFLLRLADAFELITPVLTEMFQGKEISTPDCTYKIEYDRH